MASNHEGEPYLALADSQQAGGCRPVQELAVEKSGRLRPGDCRRGIAVPIGVPGIYMLG
ncbi:MAG: hypothetical protein ABTR92_03385 [Candidatus Accumulibacter phosphatis]|jgi:hypothetical protein|uniref:hypothetical protein n=1 Tax=Candidatus Accumulibacter sp. ACC012 TaxID=2823332 RepID=UPI00145DC5B1|nr:hypothetical protein [Candidatus Accumulibacter sp. ACC012]